MVAEAHGFAILWVLRGVGKIPWWLLISPRFGDFTLELGFGLYVLPCIT